MKIGSNILKILISALLLFFMIYAIILLVPPGLGIDWRLTYRPATVAFLHGQNPYNPEISPKAPFFAAPWCLILLSPLALLPVEIGRAIIMLVGIIIFAIATYLAGAKPFAMAIFLLSPPVIHTVLNANIEWLPILGFVLPPWLGLFFVLIKPQTGFAVAIWWMFHAWNKGGTKLVIKTFAPVTIAFLLSFLAYGFWPLGMFNAIGYGKGFNASLWPLSIPIGLVLLVASLQKQDIKLAMPASPFLSPYVLFHAWSSAVFAFINNPIQLTTVVIGLWIVVGIRSLS